MPSEAIQKFKNVVDSAGTIAIRTGTTKDISKILAGFILHNLFLKLGKKSNIEAKWPSPQTKTFMEALFGETKGTEIQENLLISLDTKKFPVSNLRYEKDGDILKLILESGEKIAPDEIKISKEARAVDLLMLVDPSEEEINALSQNIPHRDIIKLTARPQGFCLKLHEIAKSVSEERRGEFADALWLLADFEEKELEFPTKEWLEMRSELLEAGADAKRIADLQELTRGKNFWKLLGRALARSEFEKDLHTVWSFLPLSDFQKTTGSTEDAVLPVLSEMQSLRKEGKFFAMLWESSGSILSSSEIPIKSINAVISGRDGASIKTLAGLMGASLASSYFFINGFGTFSEAELKIRSSIRQVL